MDCAADGRGTAARLSSTVGTNAATTSATPRTALSGAGSSWTTTASSRYVGALPNGAGGKYRACALHSVIVRCTCVAMSASFQHPVRCFVEQWSGDSRHRTTHLTARSDLALLGINSGRRRTSNVKASRCCTTIRWWKRSCQNTSSTASSAMPAGTPALQRRSARSSCPHGQWQVCILFLQQYPV